jgi:hypothetical protein
LSRRSGADLHVNTKNSFGSLEPVVHRTILLLSSALWPCLEVEKIMSTSEAASLVNKSLNRINSGEGVIANIENIYLLIQGIAIGN